MPPDQVDEVLAIMERSGAREQALAEARRFRDQAVADIASLPIGDGPREELRVLVESVIAL
jgi:geranylgeranyl pyrophosphate synthase